jgi:hypothetical protein
MKTGDYTVEGYESEIAIERKSLDDLATCLSGDCGRFQRQLERLRAFKYRAVVIEGGTRDILQGAYYAPVRPVKLLQRVSDCMARYKIPFLLADCVDDARDLALSFMRAAVTQLEK